MSASITALIGWGVDLGPQGSAASGGLYPSPFADVPDLDKTAEVRPYAWGLTCDVLFLTRSVTATSTDAITAVGSDRLAPPDEQELAALDAALAHLGYHGPREVRLLLAASHG